MHGVSLRGTLSIWRLRTLLSNCAMSNTNFSPFLDVIGPYKKRLYVVITLLMLDTVLASLGIGLVLPVFQTLLDPLHQNSLFSNVLPFVDHFEPDERMVILAGVTVMVFLVKASVSMIAAIVSNDFLQKLRFYWISKIGENYLYAPLLSIAGRKQGELLNDWFSETLSASRFFKSSLTYITSTALALALLVMGVIVNWQAMLSMLCVGAVAAFIIRTFTYKRSAMLSREKLMVNQSLNSTMVEDLANVRDLKLMSAENARLKQLDYLSEKLKSIFVLGAVLAEIPRVSGEFLAVSFLMGFVIISTIILNIPPQDVLPMLAFFFIAFYRLVSATSIAMSSRVRALNDLHSVSKVQSLIAKNDTSEKLDEGLPLSIIDTDIRFQKVSFKYNDEKYALKDVDIVFPRGQMTLLVGPSGSGKSTLLDLLMRLLEPTSGAIKANQRTASDYSLSDWRRCIGYVSQDAALFNGTIRMNLLLANPEANEADIKKACDLAGATMFIHNLPDGYDTAVGDRGFSLSGGQRKRLAIARALIANPSVLILDEATTSFEQQLETELLAGLRVALPELTIIQVTHRIHVTNDVEWMVVVEDGNVKFCGKSSEVSLDGLNISANEWSK